MAASTSRDLLITSGPLGQAPVIQPAASPIGGQSLVSPTTQSTLEALLASRSAGTSGASANKMEYFETADVPEPDNTNINNPQPYIKFSERKRVDDVISSQLKPSLAFAKFAGKLYDTTTADFSGSQLKDQYSLNDDTGATGIVVLPRSSSSSSSSLARRAMFEGPLSRFNRLKSEMDQFQQDLQQIAKQTGHDSDPNNSVSGLCSALSSELSRLQSTLSDLQTQNDQLIQVEKQSISSQASKQQFQKLLQDLQQAKIAADQEDSTTSTTASTTVSSSAPEVHYHSSLVSLDRRLASLESVIGMGIKPATQSITDKDQKADSRSIVSGALSLSSFGDLSSAVGFCASRLQLLDGARLDHLMKQAKALLTELDALEAHTPSTSTNASATASPDPTNKVSSMDDDKLRTLYASVSKWDSLAGAIPQLLSRLAALRSVHEAGLDAVARLQKVEDTLAEAERLRKQDKQMLTMMSESLSTNLKQIEVNSSSLDERLSAINAKLALLKI